MMRKMCQFVSFMPFLLIIGCSSGEDKTSTAKPAKEPIFKEQIRALEKAKEVEQLLQDSIDKHRQTIEEQSK